MENDILKAMYCDEGIKVNDDFYNKVSAHDLESKYGFDWPAFTKNMGYKVTPKNVVIGELNSFKCIVRTLKENTF